MNTRLPNVKDVYLQNKVLTRVHGKPHFESLKIPLGELKDNASLVTSTLGGGMYVHLGLLRSATRYVSGMLSQNYGSNNRSRNNNCSSGRSGRGRHNSSYGDCTQNTHSSSTRKYCWTNSACEHIGSECNTKANGHQVQETFTNMLNDSTANCYWLPT